MLVLCHNVYALAVILDGHKVSPTERQFLMSWKVMRKARRRQQKRSLEQMSYVMNEALPPSTHSIFHPSGPAPPLTLPALPARQLPHRCKKVIHQEPSSSGQIHNSTVHTEEMVGAMEFDGFKLPELAPYKSIIAQQGHLMSTLSNQQLPREKPWRTIEVATGNGMRQM